MAEIIEMIQLSPTMDAGILVEWLKKEGDSVQVGDLIAEVETDKTTMEMESFYDGTILRILAAEGSSVNVGKPLAIIGEPGEDIDALVQTLAQNASAAPTAAAKEPTTAPSTTPAAATPAAATPVAVIAGATPAQASASAASEPLRQEGERILSSPVARRVAQENQLSLDTVHGSGPAGRIIKRDVEAALHAGATSSAKEAAPRPARSDAPITAQQERSSAALSPMRKAIARNTTEAWKIPAFMLTRTIRMDSALAFRREINASLQRAGHDTGISVNDLIIKASALALRDLPEVNVAFQDDALVQYAQSRIGVAVAIEGGLLTPVVENAEARTLRSIAEEVRELAARAKAKKLSPDAYSNASFSISNLGMFGIDHFTAVLNPPGAAILAVGQSKRVLVPDDSERGFHEEQQMSVTLTCDHRALDGAVGAQWLQRFAAYLEEPLTLVV